MYQQKTNKYVFKDNIKRQLYKKLEKKKKYFKSCFFNNNLKFNLRYLIFINLSKLKKNSSKIRIRNRCILSGRGRSVYKNIRISRMQLKDLISKNLLPGIRQANW